MKVSKQNIKNLLSSVSSDGRGAFERFYNLYYDQVFRFAYYCLGEKEACKEVVSDVFFSIWKSKARLKEIDNIDTYLYITVRNEALRHISRSNSVNKIQMDQLYLNQRKKLLLRVCWNRKKCGNFLIWQLMSFPKNVA